MTPGQIVLERLGTVLGVPSNHIHLYSLAVIKAYKLYVKSKIANIIQKYGGTTLVDFNVSVFDIFAISQTLNLILMPGFDNI